MIRHFYRQIFNFIRTYLAFSLVIILGLAAVGLSVGGLRTPAHAAAIAVAVIAVGPLLWDMWQHVRAGGFGIDVLAAVAIGTSIVLGQYWTAVIIALMLTGGEALENYAGHRAQAELDALLDRAPRKAHVYRKGKLLDIAVQLIQIGDKLVVRPGEVVPADATIVDGTTSLDESSITGESVPRIVQVGDEIVSGATNIEGLITVKAIRSAADSQYEQIIKLVRSASQSQAPFVRLADRYSVPFTIISFAIAGGAWYFSGHALRFLEVLVVATPCPLLLAAPIAIISGMSRAARAGIIIKNGSALERLGNIKTAAFDKTGTITTGEPRVAGIKTYDYDEASLIGLAAALEQHSGHVLAKAVVSAAHERGIKIKPARHVRELAGNGIMAQISGQQVMVGRLQLLEQYDVAVPKGFRASSHKQTAAFVAIGGTLRGVISFSDAIRPEAAHTLERLRQAGISRFLMVTGDNAAVAQAVGSKLGFAPADITAGALPADKLRVVEAEVVRPVAFIGDGVNDAPVLTAADVGIALGARGSTAASESADVVIMLDDIGKVADGVLIAKRSLHIARQSIVGGIGLSILLMIIFASGRFSPLYGAILQEVVDVIVIVNALRAHR